jgi:hypothetical protein
MEAIKGENDLESPEESGPDLDSPLQLLSSVSARLLSGDIPTNPNRLQSLFDHIQSVVGDVVDASFEKLTMALDQVHDANEAIGELAGDKASKALLDEFEVGREHIEEGLAIMQESFFSAESLDDVQEFEEEFREAEVQLAEGLSRIETAIMRVEIPELDTLHADAENLAVEDALDAIASGLDALNAHLEDGKTDHLVFVLEKLDLARNFIEDALDDAEPPEEAEASEDDEEDVEAEEEESIQA